MSKMLMGHTLARQMLSGWFGMFWASFHVSCMHDDVICMHDDS